MVFLNLRISSLKSALTRFACEEKRFYHELSFASNGEPSLVLNYRSLPQQDDMDPPDSDFSVPMLRVEMLNAPLNPADVNSIQGRYPTADRSQENILSSLRQSRHVKGNTVAGSEGLGIVTEILGPSCHLKVGDVVTMGLGGLGTFRSSFWSPPSLLIPLERGEELYALGGHVSTLAQLGGTAIRLLRDFHETQPGEVIIQNAGNSGVGFMVSQLARLVARDVGVVSIVRRGKKTQSQWEGLVEHLTTNGKCLSVVAEEDLLSDREAVREFQSKLRSFSSTNKLPCLGLNAVGGDSASLIQRCLGEGATMVTYGGMSLRPVTSSTSSLIFRDLRLMGYWHSRWMTQNHLATKQKMINDLVDAVIDGGVMCPPAQEIALSDFQDALRFDTRQSANAIREKVVFNCSDTSKL